VEQKERKLRIEDAVSSTRAAMEEGIVAGGGASLVHAAGVLEDGLGATGDELAGVGAVAKAILEPARWIAENAGQQGYVIISKVQEMGPREGYNAASGTYGDLVDEGVIDPVKVTKAAVENAASVAGMLLTTDVLIVDKPEEDEDEDTGHGHSHHRGAVH
jgi:chaperonin GroEL